MKRKIKNKNGFFQKRQIFKMLVVLALAIFFFIISASDSLAASCRCATRTGTADYTPVGSEFQTDSRDECIQSCLNQGATHYQYGLNVLIWADAKGVTNAAKEAVDEVAKGAKTVGSIAAAPFLWVFNFLLFAVWTVCNLLLFVAAMIFDWSVNPANFTLVVGNEAVYNGWVIVRDFLNLAFILVLLFSAFCTIFQVEKYHLKKILLTLVIMALLVNFSFPIARFIIDTSNVLMYFIIGKAFPSFSESSGLSALIAKTWYIMKLTAPDFSASDILYAQNFTVKALFAIIFTFLLAITLLVVAVLLVIRIVVLAILIIFSSIGFVAAIFPSTKNFADSWWTQLFKQSFFGPIMLFMVYIALTMMEMMNKDNKLWTSVEKQVGQNASLGNYSDTIIIGTYLAIPIVILWTGLVAAQKLGAAGAGWAVGMGQKMAKWPARMAGKGLRYGAVSGLKKFERDVLASRGFSPRAFIEGWKQRAADVEKKVMGPAAGAWHARLNKWFSRGKEKSDYYEAAAIQANIREKQKQISETSEHSDFLMDRFNQVKERGGYQEVAAIFRTLFNNNDQNEMIKFFGGEAGDVEPENIKKFLFAHLTQSAIKGGMTKEKAEAFAIKQITDLSEVAFMKGNYGNYGMTVFKDGKWQLSDINEQARAAVGKGTNIEPQTKVRSWHWNSFLVEKGDGTGAGELHSIGKALLNGMTMSEVNQMNRARPDLIKNLASDSAIKSIKDHAKKVGGDQQKIIESFADRIAQEYGKKIEEATEEMKKETSKIVDQFGRPIS